MRYDDASGAFQASGPVANDDADTLAAGSRGPATGNLITGEGTQYGNAGADSAVGAHVTAIAGKGGEDTSFAAGKLSVAGEFGSLSVDAQGNYSYLANQGAPENVRDRFIYTLADNQGNTDTAALIVEIGKTPAVIKADAQQIVPGPDGVVTLPPGVELTDIMVVGRNLVINMPDGTQLIIVDGAIFVPQLVLGGVEVPATNVAALLIGQEPQPAAGELPPSSGGNFALPPPPLDPGVPLGDLIPPTEYVYQPPEPQEVLPEEDDEEPTITIEPDGQPASVAAVDSVDEAGLPTRNGGEPEGSGEEAAAGANGDPNEATSGVIHIDSPDGIGSVTINGVTVTGVVGQQIAGAFGTLTITGFVGDDIEYSYTLADNTSGDNTQDDFSVTITDLDGDQATATLTIDIIDDVPAARPDTDAIASGQYGPVTGNVITDASAGDAGDSDAGADTVGADNASITAVSSANVPANSDGSSPFVVNGQYGVLTLQADGSYSYTRNAGTPGGVQDVFNYTLTDGDGDTSSTTLTITIADAQPLTGPNPTALLDDDALANGNPGGVDDDADAANLAGTLAGSGGDGPLTYAFQLTGAPAGFTYVAGPAGSVLIQQGGVTVLTVTLNTATGAYTVTQNAPIDHAAGADENNVSFTLNYTVTDQDNDSASGTLGIDVDDDTPEIAFVDIAAPTLTVDESNLALNATGDFSALFDVNYGADGAGSTSYAVSVLNGTDSGLVDVATGQSILLFNNAGVVEGRVGGVGGQVAFTVSVNSATGVVTLDQIRAVEHPNAADPDDAVSPDATSIQLTVSAVDGDGDPVSQTIDIGANLVFEDDGPSISATGVEPQLLVDESDLTTNHTQNFGDVFSEVFGADGPDGSGTSYALGINAGPTGLTDTLTGEAVVLSLNGGVVEGRTAITNQLVFTVSINAAGDVTVDQLRAVVHPNAADPDDSINIANDNLITITATVTDGDGDTASATIGIGNNINLEDDGPSANNDSDTTSDGVATGNVITGVGTTEGGANADDPGEDGFDTITNLVSNGTADSDNNPAGGFTVTGLYGSLQMDADGNYSYTKDAEAPGGVSEVFTYTFIDGDGDPATATLTINIPDSTPLLPDPDLVQLDDDALTNGNPGGTDDDADSAGLPGQLNGSGGDGDLDYNFTGSNTLPAGFTTNLVNAGTLQILQGATVVLTITLDNETGAFNVVQNNPIDHLAGDDENNYQFSIGVEVEDVDGDTEPASITINVDDDTPVLENVTAGAGVEVDETDAGSPAGFPISDTSADPVIDADMLFGADGPAAANSVVYGLAISGGPGSGLQTAIGNFAITLVQIDGDTIEGQYQDGGTQVAFTIQMNADGTVTLTQEVPLEHLVDGAPGAPHNDTLDLDDLIEATVTITDADGDTASASVQIGSDLVFFDDGPDAEVDEEATLDTLVLDETRPVGTEEDGDSNPAGLMTVQANFADNFVSPVDYGGDGPGAVSYALALDGEDVPSGLYTVDPTDTSILDGDGYGRGDEIVLNQSGNTITGSANGTDYFTITIDPNTGVVTFTQLDNIWHANANNDDDTSTLMAEVGSLLVQQIVTDSDGDFDTASVDVSQGVFQIEDDGPVANNDVDNITGGGSSASGNVITGVGTVAGPANADDVGEDAPGKVFQIQSNNVPANVDSTPDGGGNFSVAGQYGTLVINQDGSYTYTRNDGSPGNVQDVFTYTFIDADGDTETATLTINVEDAAPNLPDPAAVLLDDDALPGGNPGGAGDDPDSAGLPGQLNGSGGDGDLDYFFTGGSTLPPDFTYNAVDATTVQILQGATVVLTITLNNETGAFNVVQNNPIDHPPGGNENNLSFLIGVEVEDADGDTEPATITINVDDDTPTVSANAAVQLDDDALTGGNPGGTGDVNPDTANTSGTLGHSYGADGAGAIAYLNTGAPDGFTYQIQGNGDLWIMQDAVHVITLTVNATTGAYTVTQVAPIMHPAGGDENDVSFTVTYRVSDHDGDTVDGTIVINVDDDTPLATVNGQAQLDVITLDESRPEGTDTPGGSPPNGDMSATANFADNFTAPIAYGADGPGSTVYSLVLSANGIGSGLYALDPTDTETVIDGYGQGAEITLSQVGNVITGSAGGVDYFTITIDPVTGVVTFTQLEPIWHPTAPGNFDESATLTTAAAANIQVVQTVTDSDGDSAQASINVGQGVFVIQDDGPNEIQPDPASLENAPGASVTADLDDDGEVITDFGEDGAGKVRFANITNGEDSGLTSDGDAIEYWLSNDGQTLQARTNSTNGSDGELIFTVQINQATGDYTVTMTGTVDNGAGVSFDDLTSSAAGNVNFRGVGEDDPGTPVDLLLSASLGNGAATSVNTDSDSIGAANQSMDDGETVRIDFVSNLVTGAATPTGFGYDAHVGTNSYIQTIPQVQGSQSNEVAFQVWALDTNDTQANEPDRNPASGFSNSTIVTITEVTVISYDNATPIVTDISGIAVGVWTDVGYGISVQKQADGSVIFTGVQEGDQYGISTGANDFNAVAVQAEPEGTGPVGNQSNEDSFDLGVFAIGQVDTGEPIDISFDLSITDADGDTITMPGAIDITLEPDTESLAVTSFAAQEEQLQKSAANSNTLTLAAAVAAAGMVESAAATPPADDQSSESQTESYSKQVVEMVSVEDGGASSVSAMPEMSEAADAPGNSGGHSQASAHQSNNSIDAASNQQASDGALSNRAANDQGSADSSADAGALPPSVGMPSAAALQAVAEAPAASAVEQVVAEALGQADAPTVDALLASLPRGNGELPALAQLASPDGHAVSGWDMAAGGAFGSTADMMLSMHAASMHHDAVQPAVNG